MRRAWRWWAVWVVVGVCLMGAGRAVAECKDAGAKGREWNPDAKGQDWTWKDADECVRTRAELDQILQQHQLWIETDHKKGQKADLSGANLSGADFTGANLREADFSGAYLGGAHLTKVILALADLSGAHLVGAHLTESRLDGADLTGAELIFANLSGAYLIGTDLTGAYLTGADLTGANLREADLIGANLDSANLTGAWYEPKTQPSLEYLAHAVGLDQLRHYTNPTPLMELRKGFQNGGFAKQGRKVTASLLRSDLELSWECKDAGCLPESLWDELRYELRYTLPKFLNWALFDWTCAWGSDWSHPLVLLGWLCLVCGPVYWVGMHFGQVGGIYQIVLDKVVATKAAAEVVTRVETGVQWVGLERLRTRTLGGAVRVRSPKLRRRLVEMALRAEWRALRLAFLFSVLSALDIGFHEFNVGVWARMLLARDFNLKARGWMRVAGGVQSLVGLGLVALSLLSYFGHPFD